MALKRQYLIINPHDLADLANQLNRVLALIGDRLDQMEGTRGTPTFDSDIDLQGHRIIHSGLAQTSTDVPTLAQALGGSIAHSALTGLTVGDDHTQYVKLVGRVGGQIVKGGGAANENLILQSTSNATRGYIESEDDFKLIDTNGVVIHAFLKS